RNTGTGHGRLEVLTRATSARVAGGRVPASARSMGALAVSKPAKSTEAPRPPGAVPTKCGGASGRGAGGDDPPHPAAARAASGARAAADGPALTRRPR